MGAREAYRSNKCALGAVSYPQLLQLQCYYTQLTMLFDHKIIIIFKIYIIPLSRTWRDRVLGAGAGATLTLVGLWLVFVSATAAAVILRA